jgi:hypothetical protein
VRGAANRTTYVIRLPSWMPLTFEGFRAAPTKHSGGGYTSVPKESDF